MPTYADTSLKPRTSPRTATGFAPPGQFGTPAAPAGAPPPLPPPGPPANAPPSLAPPTMFYEDRSGPGHFSPTTTPPVTPGSTPASATPPPAAPDPGLLSTPGAYEEWIKTHAGDLSTPTRLEDLYDTDGAAGLDHSALSDVKPSDSSATYKAWLAQNGAGPDAASSKSVLSGLSTGPSKSSDVYNTASGSLSKPGAVEDVYGKNSGAFDSTGAGEDWYSKYGADPMDKSYTETLYEGGIGQLDPAYDYALQKGLKAAQTASAARGGFNSGYAGQEERDLTANITGQQASKWADLASVADASKRARYDQGEKFAGDSNDDYRQRIQDMFGIAGENDDATNKRLSTLSSISSAADSADTSRDNTRVTAAGNADRSATDVYRATSDANKTAADLEREQGDQNIDLANKQDTSNRNNLTTKFGLAEGADAADAARFGKQASLEKDLQTFGENRITGGVDRIGEQSQREAQLTQQIYSDVDGIENMDDTALQALADKYGVKLQELNSVKDDAKSAVALLTQAVKALA